MTEKERIAIHPDFYTKFTTDLSKINTSDVSEAAKHLDEKEAKLFKKLVSEGLAYFDNGSKSWKLLV
jgi:UV DNA damage repair endonuclease